MEKKIKKFNTTNHMASVQSFIPYWNFWLMYKTTASEIGKKIYCSYSQTTIIQMS